MSLTTIVFREVSSWIGLYKLQASSTDPSPSAQYWLDGSTSTFRRWESGDPSGDTYCIRMKTTGEFDAEPCDEKLDFVCKRKGG